MGILSHPSDYISTAFPLILRERTDIAKFSKNKKTSLAFQQMLSSWYHAREHFRLFAREFDRVKLDFRKGMKTKRLPKMLEELETMVELLEKASKGSYNFANFVWPKENGRSIFKVSQDVTRLRESPS